MPPSTGILDNFSRADESPVGANWTAASTGFGKLNLTTNVLQFPSSSYRDCCWNTSFAANQEAYYTVPATTSGRFLEIFGRITNPNTANLNAYNVEINTSTGGWTLSSVLKNAYKSLGTSTKAIAAGDKVWLKCEGTSIKAIHIASGGVETTIISVTNSEVAGAGQIGCGMQSSGANLTIDDFGGGALSSGKSASLGQPSEADTAQSVFRSKARSLGQPSESEQAHAVARLKARRLGQASDVELALPVAVQKTRTIGQAAEASAALAVARGKALAVGEAVEADHPLSIAAEKNRAIGQASEAGVAQPIAHLKAVQLGQATEADVASPVVPAKALGTGQAIENDEAFPFSPAGQLVVPVGQVQGGEAARPVTIVKSRSLGQVQEASAAFGLELLKALTVGRPAENDEAQPVIVRHGQVVVLGQAFELDESRALAVVRGAGTGAHLIASIRPETRLALDVDPETRLALSVRPQTRIVMTLENE
jgi:hypothetical protein